MSPAVVDTTVSASVMLAIGAILLLVAWSLRAARQRAQGRIDTRTALVQAEALRHANRFKDARTLLQRTVAMHQRNSAVHYRLACCHSLLGDHRAAVASLKSACDLDANWAVSAMHDPDLKDLWRTGIPGFISSRTFDARLAQSNKAA